MLAARESIAESSVFQHRRAYRRSLELLLERLSPSQRTDFLRWRYFVVRGESGQRYRVTYGMNGNIEVLTPLGVVDHRLCAGPSGVPIPGVLLAQKLMLETQEAEFLRIAARQPFPAAH